MLQEDIAVIGYGVVGQNIRRLLFPWSRIVDPKFDEKGPEWSQFIDRTGERHYRVAFVCVPTDMNDDGSADTSIVRRAVEENSADVFVVKSTVPPGTCERIGLSTNKRIVFSPEFYGGTQHANAVDHNFVILGGDREATNVVAEAYKLVVAGSYRIMKTDAVTAELVKYAENAFLATKVTFFNEWYRVCLAYGVDVDEWRELLLLDERIGRSHTLTYRDHPFYDSHCLNKDIPAIIRATETDRDVWMELLATVVRLNEKWKGAAK